MPWRKKGTFLLGPTGGHFYSATTKENEDKENEDLASEPRIVAPWNEPRAYTFFFKFKPIAPLCRSRRRTDEPRVPTGGDNVQGSA